MGDARDWLPEKIRSYRRPDDDRKLGRFLVTLLVDGKPLSIELLLDYHNGKTIYRTTNPGSGGVVNDWRVPPSLTRFLQPEFLKLFIFNGEFAAGPPGWRRGGSGPGHRCVMPDLSSQRRIEAGRGILGGIVPGGHNENAERAKQENCRNGRS